MGTSTRWPGPVDGAWTKPNGNLTRLINEVSRRVVPVPRGAAGSSAASDGDGHGPDSAASALKDAAARQGQQYLDALAAELREEPDRFGIQQSMTQSGRDLITVLDLLHTQGVAALGPFPGHTPEERCDAFVARFTDQVAQQIGLIEDSWVRRAAVESADELLARSPSLRNAVETGGDSNAPLTDGLFCTIYRLFFARIVTNFFQSVIAAKITVTFPVLHLIDPAGHIATWIADKIVSILPTPCEIKSEGSDNSGSSLADLGRSLIDETVERALGLSNGGGS